MHKVQEVKEECQAVKRKIDEEAQRIADQFGVTKKLVIILAVLAGLAVLLKLGVI